MWIGCLLFHSCARRLFSSCRLYELSATTDYRRLSLTTAATHALQQPLLPPAAHSNSSDAAAAASSSIAAAARLYFWPLGPAADAAMHHLWGHHLHSSLGSSGSRDSSDNPLKLSGTTDLHDATGDVAAASGSSGPSGSSVPVMFGRTLEVPRAAGGAAWFEFDELCGRPLGSADYLALAQHYHTVFLSGGLPDCVSASLARLGCFQAVASLHLLMPLASGLHVLCCICVCFDPVLTAVPDCGRPPVPCHAVVSAAVCQHVGWCSQVQLSRPRKQPAKAGPASHFVVSHNVIVVCVTQ